LSGQRSKCGSTDVPGQHLGLFGRVDGTHDRIQVSRCGKLPVKSGRQQALVQTGS